MSDFSSQSIDCIWNACFGGGGSMTKSFVLLLCWIAWIPLDPLPGWFSDFASDPVWKCLLECDVETKLSTQRLCSGFLPHQISMVPFFCNKVMYQCVDRSGEGNCARKATRSDNLSSVSVNVVINTQSWHDMTAKIDLVSPGLLVPTTESCQTREKGNPKMHSRRSRYILNA